MSMSEVQSSRPPGVANWILAGLVAGIGVVLFLAAVVNGRTDSALLFVGLPMLLATTLTLLPARSVHGRVFLVTTVGLLVAAVFLHEGAVCVLLAAPLVYMVAHCVVLIVGAILRRPGWYAALPLPLLLIASVEGTADRLRVEPDQATHVVRVVAMPVDEVLARLADGPRPAPVRSLPLRLLGVPVPQHVHGEGLDPGDRWTFVYHQTSHGPGGQIVAVVRASDAGHLAFAFVEDTSVTARWFAWESADLTWRAVDGGHTEVTVTVHFRRALDPSWYFGPLQNGLMHEGMAHLLDMLTLT
jgi:hypothetical protein